METPKEIFIRLANSDLRRDETSPILTPELFDEAFPAKDWEIFERVCIEYHEQSRLIAEHKMMKEQNDELIAIQNVLTEGKNTLIEQNKKLRNKLSELYEAYLVQLDIAPELLRSVHQLLNETE